MTLQHKALPNQHIHQPFGWVVADQAERLAIVPGSDDVHRLLLQQSDETVWRLQAAGPVVWKRLDAKAAAEAAAAAAAAAAHAARTDNPHATTAAQVGAYTTAQADAAISSGADSRIANARGAPNGVAPLGTDQKVPAANLPSYVDDVLEYANLGAFPATGEAGKIYTALDTGKIYRWGGSTYVEISASPGSSDAVPEGVINRYYTPAREAAKLSKDGDELIGTLRFRVRNAGGMATSEAGRARLEVFGDSAAGEAAFVQFHRGGTFASYFGLDTDNQWKVGGWVAGPVAYRLWHEGNLVPSISGGPNRVLSTDAAGNLGIGSAPSPWNNVLTVIDLGGYCSFYSSAGTDTGMLQNAYYDAGGVFRYKQNGYASYYNQNFGGNSGAHAWFTAPSGIGGAPITFARAMTLTQDGRLLLGTTSDEPSIRAAFRGVVAATNAGAVDVGYLVGVDGVAAAALGFNNTGSTNAYGAPAGTNYLGTNQSQPLVFTTAVVERARITAGGLMKASNTGSYLFAGLSVHERCADQSFVAIDSGLAPSGGATVHRAQANVANAYANLYEGANGQDITFQVRANGDVRNFNNSYGALSDAKLKTAITDAPSYWDRFKTVRFVVYRLLADPTNKWLLGVLAQELREIFPGVVTETRDTRTVTKTREVTRQVPLMRDEEQLVERVEISEVNGKWVRREIAEPKTVQVPVVDEHLVYDEAGHQVMELVTPAVEAVVDEEGVELSPAIAAVYQPLIHRVPRMHTVTEIEEYNEIEETGEVTLSVSYSVLALIAAVVTQEMQGRVEALEAQPGAA